MLSTVLGSTWRVAIPSLLRTPPGTAGAVVLLTPRCGAAWCWSGSRLQLWPWRHVSACRTPAPACAILSTCSCRVWPASWAAPANKRVHCPSCPPFSTVLDQAVSVMLCQRRIGARHGLQLCTVCCLGEIASGWHMLPAMLHVSSLQRGWGMTSMLTSCWSLQISYQKALAAVFVEGCIFILLALTGAPFQSLEIDPFLPLNATWAGLHAPCVAASVGQCRRDCPLHADAIMSTPRTCLSGGTKESASPHVCHDSTALLVADPAAPLSQAGGLRSTLLGQKCTVHA